MITALHIGQNHLVNEIFLDISSRDIDNDSDNDSDNANASDHRKVVLSTRLCLLSARAGPSRQMSDTRLNQTRGRSHSKLYWTCDKLHSLKYCCES